MRIALTADPELPVPPKYYGGIERVVDMLARGLTERGHEVTLFAHPDSSSVGTLIPWRGLSSGSLRDTMRNAWIVATHTASGQFDVVHSFSRIAYLTPVLPLPVPKLMTYQRPISRRSVRLGHVLSHGTLHFSAISHWMMRHVADVGQWHMVFNGVPFSTYTFQPEVAPDAPLIFLGRIEEIKGPHIAIEVARRSGIPLIIAGNIPDAHRGWYERMILPHVDGARIQYVGPVTDVQKNSLLGSALAFLMPISWDEPFGIVMAEAMACGTPVVGFDRGAVAEVVEDGVTGFVVPDLESMVAAALRARELDRRAVRDRAQRLFSDEAVVRGYLSVYESMLPG